MWPGPMLAGPWAPTTSEVSVHTKRDKRQRYRWAVRQVAEQLRRACSSCPWNRAAQTSFYRRSRHHRKSRLISGLAGFGNKDGL